MNPSSKALALPGCAVNSFVVPPIGQTRTDRSLTSWLPLAALALLPDDDDEDLVSKAKENRKSRLKSEITTQKQFARTEGFKDTSLAPLQKAVTQLARVGSQLSSGDVSAASGTLRCVH